MMKETSIETVCGKMSLKVLVTAIVCMAASLTWADHPIMSQPYAVDPTAMESSAPVNVTLNSSRVYQTIEGLGGALVFYNGWFTAHPYKEEIYDHAFSGLNLSMLRLGNWWRGNGQDREAYEFVAAANQRLSRPVPILISSWSPPAYLKSNGQEGNGGTLVQINGEYDYAGFADYWYDSIQDYIAHGVVPTWIGIQNEPDWTADYESCRFNPSEAPWNGQRYASFALALEAVHQRLEAGMASPPKLLGPENVGLYGNAGALRDYMEQMNADRFYGIAHHLYGGSTDGSADGYNPAFNTVRDVSHSLFPGKPRFMTEYGDIYDMIGCANLIHNSLVIEQVSGYNHWSLIWPGEIGLVEIEFPWGSYGEGGEWTHPKGYWLNPSYWAMKHYSYFVQPGFRRVDAACEDADVLVSAYLSPDQGRLVTVLINRDTSDPVGVNLNDDSFTYNNASVYQTEGQHHFVSLGPAGGSPLVLPASSLTTVVAQRADGEYRENGGVLSMEAENGTLGDRWLRGEDTGASNDAFIEIDPAYHSGGSAPECTSIECIATYDFHISTVGNYRFWFRMYSGGRSRYSFFWRIDNGNWILEDGLSRIGSWYSADDTQVDNLGSGNHVLQVGYREGGTRLDKFVVQLDSLAAPGDDGPAESQQAPPAPIGLSAVRASSTRIELTWLATPGATSYNVKRATTSGGPYVTIAPGVVGTSYADTDPAPETQYYYVVSAIIDNIEGSNSAEASAGQFDGPRR